MDDIDDSDWRPLLSRTIAVTNGKGGVGKTSSTANIADRLSSKFRVLVVDLDPQGNLTDDEFGLEDSDRGRGLAGAVLDHDELTPVSVQPGIDLIPGGSRLEMLVAASYNPALGDDLPGGSVGIAFAQKLATIADDYDFILLDCPPRNVPLQGMALQAARWVLIPTRTDKSSREGIRGVGPHVRAARATNPTIDYLGVFIFATTTSFNRGRDRTRQVLDEIADVVPMFDTYIRYSEAVALDSRESAQLLSELHHGFSKASSTVISALRAARKARRAAGPDASTQPLSEFLDEPLPTRTSSSVKGVHEDYGQLTKELVRRIRVAEELEGAAS